MRRAMVGALSGAMALMALAAAPPNAGADGLPVTATGREGVASTDGEMRYVALRADRGTVVARISQETGKVLKDRYLPREVGIPAVAFDGSAAGLSADGSTLAVMPNYLVGRSRTELDVLDARSLTVRDHVRLNGSFTFDAISPDGGIIYLVEYLSPRDLTQYNVRAYDVERGRLLPDPITDPEESGEQMYGMAMTRVMSPDGRWAYTLYDGRGEDFIHALDTERGEAVCIDLDELQTKVWRLDMKGSADGGTLRLTHKEDVEAVVDTKTFEVTYPHAAPATEAPSDGDGGGSDTWIAVAVAAGTAATLAVVLLRRRRAAAAT
jgi:hypothetical protein